MFEMVFPLVQHFSSATGGARSQTKRYKRYYYTLHCSLFRLSVLIVELSFRVDVLHVMVFFQSVIAAGLNATLYLFVYRSAILPAQAGLHVDFTLEEKR